MSRRWSPAGRSGNKRRVHTQDSRPRYHVPSCATPRPRPPRHVRIEGDGHALGECKLRVARSREAVLRQQHTSRISWLRAGAQLRVLEQGDRKNGPEPEAGGLPETPKNMARVGLTELGRTWTRVDTTGICLYGGAELRGARPARSTRPAGIAKSGSAILKNAGCANSRPSPSSVSQTPARFSGDPPPLDFRPGFPIPSSTS